MCVAVPILAGCYYYGSSLGKWTAEDMKVAEHYYTSVRADREYNRIIKSGNPRRQFTIEEKAELRRQVEIALREARIVLDHPQFLEKMHPDMRVHFRDEYLRSLELTLRNFDMPNARDALDSTNLHNTYVIWYEFHLGEIRRPREVQ